MLLHAWIFDIILKTNNFQQCVDCGKMNQNHESSEIFARGSQAKVLSEGNLDSKKLFSLQISRWLITVKSSWRESCNNFKLVDNF